MCAQKQVVGGVGSPQARRAMKTLGVAPLAEGASPLMKWPCGGQGRGSGDTRSATKNLAHAGAAQGREL